MTDVTRILNAIEQGETKATDNLLPLLYEELRSIAAQKLAQERPGHTLQATALVHEAYVRLIGSTSQNWQNRGHFFSAAAEAMRRILIDNARRKRRVKRGGDHHRIELNEATMADQSRSEDLLALDEALTRLDEHDSTAAELVKLRYFSGLTLEEIAQVQGLSRSTVTKNWTYARAWLHRELRRGDTIFPKNSDSN